MQSPMRRALIRATRSPQFIVGLILVLFFVVVSFTGPSIAPYSPTAQKMSARLHDPTVANPLGTDDFGRDVFSRILHGAMASLAVGVLSVVFSLVVGLTLGLAAAYNGGWVDTVVSGFMDVLFAFPAILLAIAMLAVFGSSLINVILAIGIVNLPTFARLARASTLSTKSLAYVEAAHSLGVPSMSIAWRHIVPNILAPMIVQTSLTIAAAVLIEAALSYLGLGVQPPAPSWGNILASTYGFIQTNPWPAIFAGIAIALAVLGFNLLGDGLRDALDPTTR